MMQMLDCLHYTAIRLPATAAGSSAGDVFSVDNGQLSFTQQ